MLKSSNILQKEQEFLKLNEEIDSKTKDLLTEVDYIKEIQLNNEEYFKNWEKQESLKSEENYGDKSDQENLSINNLENSDNDLLNSFSKIKLEASARDNLSSGKSSVKSVDFVLENKNFRKNGKLSRSAKAISLVTPLDQESSLSLASSKHKTDFALTLGNDVIPETLKEVGNDGIIRFLTAKVKLLTEQVEKMQKEEKKNLEKIKELQNQKQKFTEEKEKMQQQINSSKNLLIKQEQQFNNAVDQLKFTRNENNNLKKELEMLKKEIRECNKNNSSNEVRLNRSMEEIERLKSTIQQMKQEDKETKESYKKKTEELSNEVKTLDRQRNELMNGFKKQMALIENLKQQKELVEASRLIKLAKEDFINFLDSNPPDFDNPKNSKPKKS